VGRLACGFSTGFLYAGPLATRWLVTNWHVVTGRRPDDPGILLGDKPSSPHFLRFGVEDPAGTGCQQIEVPLYDNAGPRWIEADRQSGVDLALIRLTDRPNFAFPVSQNFAPTSSNRMEPGLDVVTIGYPFKLGQYAPSAIWKSAMVASDQDPGANGRPWILVDAPGEPGMSGSPVYRRFVETSPTNGSQGGATTAVGLELMGVYAGAVGDRKLENLRLGRVFPIALVENLLQRSERGHNPFPPEFSLLATF
jgi:S1-C subfamily serine protease